jgi:hypothetical protein
MYDPRIGRFIEPDFLGLEADINTYRPVRNSPTNLTDPSGQAPVGPGFSGTPGSYDIEGLATPQPSPSPPPKYSSPPQLPSSIPLDAFNGTEPVGLDGTPIPPKRMPCDATEARLYIEQNYRKIKDEIVGRLLQLLNEHPPKRPVPTPDKQGTVSEEIPLTEEQKLEIASKVADAYINAVDKFLKNHPGAAPELARRWEIGETEFPQGPKDHPWCADWSLAIEADLRKAFDNDALIDSTLGLEMIQMNTDGYQHNWNGIYSRGNKAAVPDRKSGVVHLDPWHTITPDSYSSSEHPEEGTSWGTR